jgi:RNA polymerase sigma-70 factor, ECF subfamily
MQGLRCRWDDLSVNVIAHCASGAGDRIAGSPDAAAVRRDGPRRPCRGRYTALPEGMTRHDRVQTSDPDRSKLLRVRDMQQKAAPWHVKSSTTPVARGVFDQQSDGKIEVTDRSSRVPQTATALVDSPGNSTGSELAQRAREALAEQAPVLLAVARGLCRDQTRVEDLVQDVFEKALRSIDTLDLNNNPRGWMVTILYNLHIDRCRELARRQPDVPFDDVQLSSPEPADAPIWSALTANDVRQAAAQLPDELRETYVLFAFEGRSYTEIAGQLGIAKATVGTRILRARGHLKRLLSASLPEDRA